MATGTWHGIAGLHVHQNDRHIYMIIRYQEQKVDQSLVSRVVIELGNDSTVKAPWPASFSELRRCLDGGHFLEKFTCQSPYEILHVEM